MRRRIMGETMDARAILNAMRELDPRPRRFYDKSAIPAIEAVLVIRNGSSKADAIQLTETTHQSIEKYTPLVAEVLGPPVGAGAGLAAQAPAELPMPVNVPVGALAGPAALAPAELPMPMNVPVDAGAGPAGLASVHLPTDQEGTAPSLSLPTGHMEDGGQNAAAQHGSGGPSDMAQIAPAGAWQPFEHTGACPTDAPSPLPGVLELLPHAAVDATQAEGAPSASDPACGSIPFSRSPHVQGGDASAAGPAGAMCPAAALIHPNVISRCSIVSWTGAGVGAGGDVEPMDTTDAHGDEASRGAEPSTPGVLRRSDYRCALGTARSGDGRVPVRSRRPFELVPAYRSRLLAWHAR